MNVSEPDTSDLRLWELPPLRQMQSLLNGSPFQLVCLDLLQQPTVVVINVQVEIPLRRPLPRREEQRPAVDALVTQDAQQRLASIFRRGKLNANVLHVLEGFGRQNLGLDVPGVFPVSMRAIWWRWKALTHHGEMTFTRLP